MALVATSFPLLMPLLSWLPHLLVLEDLGMVLEPFSSILHVDVLLPTYLPTVVSSPPPMASNQPSSVVQEVTRSSPIIIIIIPRVLSLHFNLWEDNLLVCTSLVSCSFQEEQPRCLLHYHDI